MLNIENAAKKQTVFVYFSSTEPLIQPHSSSSRPNQRTGQAHRLTGRKKNIALSGKLFTLFLCIGLLLTTTEGYAKKTTRFPTYPIIEANVQFWQDVYGKYSSRQGILHDKDNLAIVYGIIDLVDWNTPGATRINKELIKLARHRYKNILTDLAGGQKPRTGEEKRVAALFPPAKHTRYLKARDNIRLQIGQKDRFLKGVIRSGAYMPNLQAIFRAHNMPVELAYLPHVESSFNPKAHSKAGAVGLWQFTRGTGRGFMTINSVLDERYDPFLSSQAAAKLLKKNYRQLGSWPLALTAYNYGRAGMVRALRTQKTYENIFKNHKTRIFKFASRNFYSEFVAALRVARKLEKDRSIIRDHPTATVSIRMDGYADTGKIRRYFKLSRKDFARFNPALRDPVLKGKKYIPKGYLLRLPATKLIRQRAGKLGTRFYHSRQIRDHVYTVRKGDTIGSIGRRFGVSTRALIRANNLNRKATIRIGRKLVLPKAKTVKRSKSIPILKDRAKRKP